METCPPSCYSQQDWKKTTSYLKLRLRYWLGAFTLSFKKTGVMTLCLCIYIWIELHKTRQSPLDKTSNESQLWLLSDSYCPLDCQVKAQYESPFVLQPKIPLCWIKPVACCVNAEMCSLTLFGQKDKYSMFAEEELDTSTNCLNPSCGRHEIYISDKVL